MSPTRSRDAFAGDHGSSAASVQPRVLAFYRDLAFNRHSSVKQQVRDIKKHDPVSAYPVLQPLLGRGIRVLEVGSGTGWLSNSIGRHYGAEVTGIDMNPDAVEFSGQVADALRQPTRFECADLFSYTPERPFPIVISMGVLHHTHDCIGAVRASVFRVARPRRSRADRSLSPPWSTTVLASL